MWEIIDAIGSFGGMLLAGAAGYVAYRLFKVDSELFKIEAARDARLEESAARQQASSVAMWFDDRKLTLANLSSLPIYRIFLSVDVDVFRPSTDEVNELLDEMEIINFIYTSLEDHQVTCNLSSLRPGETHKAELPPLDWTSFQGSSGETYAEHQFGLVTLTSGEDFLLFTYSFSMIFTDNGQRAWTRSADGELSESDTLY